MAYGWDAGAAPKKWGRRRNRNPPRIKLRGSKKVSNECRNNPDDNRDKDGARHE